jgi:hypothetical protein
MSTLDCHNINYEAISNALLYKKLNPPKYRTYAFRGSHMRERLSKAVLLMYDVPGLGLIFERFIFNNENRVVFIKYSYLSNKQRQSDREKNRKRQSDREKNMEIQRQRIRLNRKKYVEGK